MPLTGQAKKDYQRDYMRKHRANVRPIMLDPVRPKIEGLKIEGNRIVGLTRQEVIKQPSLPVYNPAIHRPGDKVLIQRGKQWLPYLVPDLDAGGQSIPDYW